MKKKTCVLILDNIRSVENTGSIFRTAEGLGVNKIILVGTTPAPVDRFGRKRSDFAKVSLGTEEMVEWEYKKEVTEVIQELKEQNFEIIALEQSSDSVSLSSYKPKGNFALIVGNEVEGVSKVALELSNTVLEIPMQGKKESLNVSVSTGIALYKLLAD
jgi:23S rRNA (guanosine2251-2'-O)-methyltransferase